LEYLFITCATAKPPQWSSKIMNQQKLSWGLPAKQKLGAFLKIETESKTRSLDNNASCLYLVQGVGFEPT
jgi:hypothetical protein